VASQRRLGDAWASPAGKLAQAKKDAQRDPHTAPHCAAPGCKAEVAGAVDVGWACSAHLLRARRDPEWWDQILEGTEK